MRRGRPFEPGNKFGCGRPTGSPNKKAQQAQKLFEENSPALMALAINRSREDPQMLRMLASHVVPERRSLNVNIGCLRSEEHTSELQSLRHLVCRLLLEKKKKKKNKA